jgi:hypothetical protein
MRKHAATSRCQRTHLSDFEEPNGCARILGVLIRDAREASDLSRRVRHQIGVAVTARRLGTGQNDA